MSPDASQQPPSKKQKAHADKMDKATAREMTKVIKRKKEAAMAKANKAMAAMFSDDPVIVCESIDGVMDELPVNLQATMASTPRHR